MAKQQVASSEDDEKVSYTVAEGVTFAAGRKVAPGDQLRLTPDEALYEDALGRFEKPAEAVMADPHESEGESI